MNTATPSLEPSPQRSNGNRKKFSYDELEDPKTGFRLLTVLHASPSKIVCSLRNVLTISHEKYNCLSYTWGDPFGRLTTPPDVLITVNDFPLHIGHNLAAALVSLYEVQKPALTAIWVDAVCINQKNDAEKGHQVKKMHDIYAGAENVIIWLGPEEDAGDVRSVRKVANAIRAEPSLNAHDGVAFWDTMVALNDGEGAKRTDVSLVHALNADNWLVVLRLCSRAYWRRLWVWQEVIAAKRDPVVVVERGILSWEDLRLASHGLTIFGEAAMIRQGRPAPASLSPAGSRMLTQNRPHQLAWWRDQYMAKGPAWIRKKFGMLVLQGNRNAYTCFNERDRIFAHTGICKYEKLEEYSRPFRELYIYFWCEILGRTKEVNFLTLVEDASARELESRPEMSQDKKGAVTLPSWVPDLRTNLEPPSIWEYFQSVERFDISKGVEGANSMTVDHSLERLKIHGYLFDTIDKCGETSKECRDRMALPRILDLMDSAVRDSQTPYGSQSAAKDAFWSTLAVLMDTDVDPSYPVPEALKTRAQLWVLHNLATSKVYNHSNVDVAEQDRVLQGMGDLTILGMSPLQLVLNYADRHPLRVSHINRGDEHQPSTGGQSSRQSSAPRPAINEAPADHDVDMMVIASGDYALLRMRLFRTRKGWLGKGPQSLLEGDELWIIPGGRVALVLRRKNGVHSYVGHAYVHGIMEGEVCEKLKGSDLTEVILA